MTNKQQIQQLLSRVHPDLDVDDEEALFGRIVTDYEEYAAMIDNYDRDVAQAGADGEVRGRNRRIEQLLAPPRTDGIPYLGSSGTNWAQSASSIFDLADKA